MAGRWTQTVRPTSTIHNNGGWAIVGENSVHLAVDDPNISESDSANADDDATKVTKITTGSLAFFQIATPVGSISPLLGNFNENFMLVGLRYKGGPAALSLKIFDGATLVVLVADPTLATLSSLGWVTNFYYIKRNSLSTETFNFANLSLELGVSGAGSTLEITALWIEAIKATTVDAILVTETRTTTLAQVFPAKTDSVQLSESVVSECGVALFKLIPNSASVSGGVLVEAVGACLDDSKKDDSFSSLSAWTQLIDPGAAIALVSDGVELKTVATGEARLTSVAVWDNPIALFLDIEPGLEKLGTQPVGSSAELVRFGLYSPSSHLSLVLAYTSSAGIHIKVDASLSGTVIPAGRVLLSSPPEKVRFYITRSGQSWRFFYNVSALDKIKLESAPPPTVLVGRVDGVEAVGGWQVRVSASTQNILPVRTKVRKFISGTFVRLGASYVVDAERRSDRRLVFISPQSESGGFVDVEVGNRAGAAVLKNGFEMVKDSRVLGTPAEAVLRSL